MKISFETPNALLDNNFNDYDYCLAAQMDNPQYSHYFFQHKKPIILDNSIAEDTPLSFDRFANLIMTLKPEEYIVPDVINDQQKTLKNWNTWMEKYWDVPGKKIGVVQGKTLLEAIISYKFFSQLADKIAIPFGGQFLLGLPPLSDAYLDADRRTLGRPIFIKLLIECGLWNYSKPHHLLGCNYPKEFYDNRDLYYNVIESIDTSNPVLNGYFGIDYTETGSNIGKQRTKIDEIFDKELSKDQIDLINFNVNIFKGWYK